MIRATRKDVGKDKDAVLSHVFPLGESFSICHLRIEIYHCASHSGIMCPGQFSILIGQRKNLLRSVMKTIRLSLTIIACALISLSCNSSSNAPTRRPAVTVYVTNEASGDLSVIDAANNEVIATLSLGKRPRGVHITPDRKNILVALSGSPIAPPGVDEDTLPPPDKKADGIGIVD